MPTLNSKALFISHTWSRNQPQWKKVVDWFEHEPDFAWKNCSLPDPGVLPDKTSTGLSQEMTRQIAAAQAVIILSDMYAENRAWIDYEIKEAKRLHKFIIGVAPLERGSAPKTLVEAADLMVGGTSTSVVGTVRYLV